jgi:hypothetical protein
MCNTPASRRAVEARYGCRSGQAPHGPSSGRRGPRRAAAGARNRSASRRWPSPGLRSRRATRSWTPPWARHRRSRLLAGHRGQAPIAVAVSLVSCASAVAPTSPPRSGERVMGDASRHASGTSRWLRLHAAIWLSSQPMSVSTCRRSGCPQLRSWCPHGGDLAVRMAPIPLSATAISVSAWCRSCCPHAGDPGVHDHAKSARSGVCSLNRQNVSLAIAKKLGMARRTVRARLGEQRALTPRPPPAARESILAPFGARLLPASPTRADFEQCGCAQQAVLCTHTNRSRSLVRRVRISPAPGRARILRPARQCPRTWSR